MYAMAEADQTDPSRSGRWFIEVALVLLPHSNDDAVLCLSSMAFEGYGRPCSA